MEVFGGRYPLEPEESAYILFIPKPLFCLPPIPFAFIRWSFQFPRVGCRSHLFFILSTCKLVQAAASSYANTCSHIYTLILFLSIFSGSFPCLLILFSTEHFTLCKSTQAILVLFPSVCSIIPGYFLLQISPIFLLTLFSIE